MHGSDEEVDDPQDEVDTDDDLSDDGHKQMQDEVHTY